MQHFYNFGLTLPNNGRGRGLWYVKKSA